MRISRDHILQATDERRAPWAISDGLLYSLCRKYPNHRQAKSITAKMLLIGRAYAATAEQYVKTRHCRRYQGKAKTGCAYLVMWKSTPPINREKGDPVGSASLIVSGGAPKATAEGKSGRRRPPKGSRKTAPKFCYIRRSEMSFRQLNQSLVIPGIFFLYPGLTDLAAWSTLLVSRGENSYTLAHT
jgi:hypothetical protein